jgi:hypothetical protein
VGGETRKAKKDLVYRANERGESTYQRTQAEAVAAELLSGYTRVEPGKRKLVETRRQVENGWRIVADVLSKDGHHDLANDVRRFVERMPPAKTAREQIAHELQQRVRDARVRDLQRTRRVRPHRIIAEPCTTEATDSREISCTSRHELDTIWRRSHNCA